MPLTPVIVMAGERTFMDVESSFLKQDLAYLVVCIKKFPEGNTLLQSIPLLVMKRTNLSILLVCLDGSCSTYGKWTTDSLTHYSNRAVAFFMPHEKFAKLEMLIMPAYKEGLFNLDSQEMQQ